MTTRKKLIEVALPLEAINIASAREKSIRHGHPSTLHLWWARRPLAAARAVIFSSLVDDPDSPDAPPAFVQACRKLDKGPNATINDTPRMRLFDFIEVLVQWESTTDERVLSTARRLINLSTDGHPPPLLDPFAGGGSIPLEAQRLGLEAHASDLNPVAVMINKAQIEIPPRFAGKPPVNPDDRKRKWAGDAWQGAKGLAADVRYYGAWMREKAWAKIGHLYPTYNGETVIAWIWARTVKSPNPAVNCHVPLVRSFELSKKKGRRAYIVPTYDPKTNTISYEVKHGDGKAHDGTVNRKGGRCIVSDTAISFDYIRTEGRAGRMGAQLMAVVTEGQGGRSYYSPTPDHIKTAEVEIPIDAPNTDLPEQALGFRVQLYGMTKHRDLFTPRQLVALTTFSDLVGDARTQAYKDAVRAGLPDDDVPLRDGGQGARAYAEAVSVYLAFLVDQLANHQSSICSWNSTNAQMRNVFARQAIPMTWDYAESNPFCESSGSYQNLFERQIKGFDALGSGSIGLAYQHDAARLDMSQLTFFSTDPPYYDNIGYADLSDYFYVWLRRSLQDSYPDIFGTLLVPKSPELIATPYRFGGSKEAANKFFEQGLFSVFLQMQKHADPRFPVTVYYAFKQSETDEEDDGDDDDNLDAGSESTQVSTGWETLLAGLINAGFSITGTWPTHTERKGRTIGIGTNALASSIVLVCRPRADTAPTISRRGFVETLRRELPPALKNMQSGNIAPVDLAQASIGPGMAVYSRYSKVLEADGSALTVRAALGLINQELDAYLAETEGSVDGDTRFAISWFEQFAFRDGEFGQADVLARAKNTSVDGVARAGVVASERGKVRLIHWSEYDSGAYDPAADKRPTVWEGTHHMIERLLNVKDGGEERAALLLNKMNPELASEARALAYRLYNICDRKGWADYARDYNAIVVQWPAISERAEELKSQGAQNVSTRQNPLFE